MRLLIVMVMMIVLDHMHFHKTINKHLKIRRMRRRRMVIKKIRKLMIKLRMARVKKK